jgi:PAS domain-containing protein
MVEAQQARQQTFSVLTGQLLSDPQAKIYEDAVWTLQILAGQMMADPLSRVDRDASVYEDAFSVLTDGVAVIDQDGTLLTINPSGKRLLGLDAEQELSGCVARLDRVAWSHRGVWSNWKVTLPDGSPCLPQHWPLRLCLNDGQERRNLVLGLERPGQSQVWLNVSVTPLTRKGEVRPYRVVASFSALPSQIHS